MPAKDILLVGSGLEARLALHSLSQLDLAGVLHHLPTQPQADEAESFVRSGLIGEVGKEGPRLIRVADVWGKPVFTIPLPKLSVLEPYALGPVAGTLAMGLVLKRARLGPQGVTVSFSDGTELLCQAVIFADGPESQGRAFWNKPEALTRDPHSVLCWSFVSKDYEGRKTWDFRWAAAKSVELVPLGQERVRVRLRFKSPHGSRLPVAELRELFSEFGRDISALFENIGDAEIQFSEESKLNRAIFCPAPGCLSLGRAAFINRPHLCFDWLSRFVDKQLAVLIEQLRLDILNTDSFEAQSRESLKDLSEAESFFRKQLNDDSLFLRPLRNLFLQWLPNALLRPRLLERLYFS